MNSELDAAIGVDQEEALAALVSTELQEDNNKEDDERREIEKYLVGFTHNLLGELNSLDGLDRFEKARHKMTFHPVDSGILFDYVQEEIQREWLPDNRISETVMAAMKKDKLYSQSDAALIYDDNGSSAGYTILLNHGNASASNDIVATDIVLV